VKASDIMTKNVIYATLPSSREKVLNLFKKYGISAVPVVKNDEVVGIVTRKDILRKIDEDQLALLMTPNPVTVQHDESLRKIVDIFVNTRFKRLPVVDGKKLVGIITVRDVVKLIAEKNIDKSVKDYITPSAVCVWEETPLNVVGEIMRVSNTDFCIVLNSNSEISGLIDEKIMLTESLIEEFIEQHQYSSSSDTDDLWSWSAVRDYTVKYFEVSVLKLPRDPVKKFMKEATYVYPQTSVSKCARKMVKNDLDHVPVLDSENRVIGLVTDKNLIRVLLESNEV